MCLLLKYYGTILNTITKNRTGRTSFASHQMICAAKGDLMLGSRLHWDFAESKLCPKCSAVSSATSDCAIQCADFTNYLDIAQMVAEQFSWLEDTYSLMVEQWAPVGLFCLNMNNTFFCCHVVSRYCSSLKNDGSAAINIVLAGCICRSAVKDNEKNHTEILCNTVYNISGCGSHVACCGELFRCSSRRHDLVTAF